MIRVTVSDVADELRRHRVILVSKRDAWTQRTIARFYPPWAGFFTTIRWPWCAPRIYYPSWIGEPMDHPGVIDHELVHVRQQLPWWAPWLLPLLAFGWARWICERPAYLRDIDCGRHTPESAAEVLWLRYGQPRDCGVMIKWFEIHKGKQ